ncbi:protein kinase [Nonomuraea sp. LP-02]|uniref:protein kinase domain-containing protein n=1 Tax=Nonomuraea sp. LP-02 TaxID=3097960 RepID=UPI002E31C2D4|nr:protein kinase [Nonomuraea sp. LP-02]MED7923526.1 protein kinase [Nonomuraea sp. LP-02]
MPQIRPLRPSDPERVAGWRLVGVLGSGGQGTVYKAVGDDGREVAVKLLHSHLSGDDGITRGFLREVEAARRVAAFCTAAVLDVGTADERPYIVSEYVAGDTLQQVVRSEGPRTGGALDRLAISTLTALAAIHQAGIVHRDFKPGNVLIGPEGPIVIDFGIAKALDATTMASGVVGTPTYMSPEQFEGQRVGPASDMFSWAGTMVFAATGRPAYAGATVPAILNAVLSGSPDLDGVPERLAEVLRPCFARDPALRPSPTELMKRLMTHRGPAVPFPLPGPSPDHPATPTPTDPGVPPSGHAAMPGTAGPSGVPLSHAAMPAAPGPGMQSSGPAAIPDAAWPSGVASGHAGGPAAAGPDMQSSGPAAMPDAAWMPSGHAGRPGAVGPGAPPPGHAAMPGVAGPGGVPSGQAAAVPGGGGGVPASNSAGPWPGAGGPVAGPGRDGGRPNAEGHGSPGGRREQGTVEGRGSGGRGRGFQGRPYHGGVPDPETSPGGARKGVSRRAVLSAGAAALATAAVSAFVALRPDGGAARHDGTLNQPPVPDAGTTGTPSTIGSPAPTSTQPSIQTPTQTPATPVAAEPFGTLIGDPAALPAGTGAPSAAMGARGPFVALGGSNGSVVAWDVTTGQARRLGDGGAATTALAYGNSRGEPVIASGHADGRMRLWRPSGESLASHKAPDPIIAVTVTAMGRVVAVSQKYDSLRDLRGIVRLWDVTTGKQIGPTSTEHFQGVNGLAFGLLGDADVLVTGDGANRVRVRPLSTGVVSGTFKTGEIGGIERLACGKLKGVQVLVSTHLDGTLRVYDLKSGKRRKKWDFSDRSPDDRGTAALVTGTLGGAPVAVVAHTPSGGDAFVRVWSLADGEIVGEFGSGEGGGIRALALAEQAVTRPVVATLGADRRLRLWSLGTG